MFHWPPLRLRFASISCSVAALLLGSQLWLLASAAEKAETARNPDRAKPAPTQAPEKPAGQVDVADPNPKQDGAQSDYVRIRRNSRRLAVALETAVITMSDSRKFPGATVDLIGAIHLGEREYYQKLNEQFPQYDALLFEAVMPEEAVRRGYRPGGGGRILSDEDQWTEAKIGLAAISVLQLGMKDALGLEFQLAAVDYTRPNFVHADMTSEEFEATMLRRGESFTKMLAREMGKAMSRQGEQNPLALNLDLMLSAVSGDRVYRVRRIAAVQLAKGSEGELFAGSDGTSTIITERNLKALEVLAAELQKGTRRIGIFYGAAHLADMEKRLIDDHGFVRTGDAWHTAWRLREEAATTTP